MDRYSIHCDDGGIDFEDPNGDWCKWENIEPLEKENNWLKQQVKMLMEDRKNKAKF